MRRPDTGIYTDLSVRDRTTCAVRSDGVVECWGGSMWGDAPASRTAVTGAFLDVSTSGRMRRSRLASVAGRSPTW
jgi:hypothetical protein